MSNTHSTENFEWFRGKLHTNIKFWNREVSSFMYILFYGVHIAHMTQIKISTFSTYLTCPIFPFFCNIMACIPDAKRKKKEEWQDRHGWTNVDNHTASNTLVTSQYIQCWLTSRVWKIVEMELQKLDLHHLSINIYKDDYTNLISRIIYVLSVILYSWFDSIDLYTKNTKRGHRLY